MKRALVLAMLFAACDAPVKPYEPQLNVFCVLRNDVSHAVAFVGRSVSYEDWNRGSDWNGVDSATVVVTRGKDSTYLRSLPETTGYYLSESLCVAAGSSYGLVVRTPEGDEARGSTTVPGSFTIGSIDTTTDRGHLQVRITWTASQGAHGYELLVSSFYAEDGGDTLCLRYSVSSDSCSAGLWIPLSRNTAALAAVGLSVGALDRNYRDYLTMQNVYGYRNTFMHIDGGLGVFGSICVAETAIYPTQSISPSTLGRSVRPSR